MTNSKKCPPGWKPPGWAVRINAAVRAGKKPSYSDLEEGVTCLLNENAVLKDFAAQANKLIAKMIFSRHRGDSDQVLADLDTFVKEHVTVRDGSVVPKKQY